NSSQNSISNAGLFLSDHFCHYSGTCGPGIFQGDEIMKRWLVILCLTPFQMSWALEAGTVTGTDNGLYQQSIKSTKKSLDREMIEVLYHDAMDAYSERHYDEALELLDKIYSLDPTYQDVAKLRISIRKSQTNQQYESSMDGVRGFMHQGDEA